MGGDDFSQRVSRTKGREATEGVIPGRFALSVGKPDLPAPPGWRWTALSDVAQLESGHTPSRKHPEYWNEGIPWIGIRDAVDNHGRQIHDTYQHVSQLGLENSSARLLPPRTVCLSRTASVGYVVVMGTTMATSQDFVNWVCGPGLEPEYLKYVLLAENDSLLRFASGTTHQTIYYPEAKAFHALLPPVDVQRAVVRVVGALDDTIELNRKMNATLEAMARALFKSWFVDFDPVRAKAEGRAPSGMDAETAKLFPSEIVESELGPIPKGWSPRAVGDLAVLSGGKQLQRELIFDTGSFPVFGGAGIMGFTAGHNADGFVISVGRVGAYCGQFFSHRGKAWINNNASLIRPNDERIAEWMFIALKHADIDVIKKGAAQPFVSNGDIANLKILWPGERTVAAFSSLLVPLINANTRNDAESTALARIRDELLPRLLSGELPVGAAERAVEEVA